MARLQKSGAAHPWHVIAGESAEPANNLSVSIDPTTRSLLWCGLRVVDLAADASTTFTTGVLEMAVLPLSGAVRVEVEGQSFSLRDRTNVFHGIADWCYIPIDAEVRITATDGPAQIAVPSARAERRFDPAMIAAETVPVELRGAGQATRQLNNFMAPEIFDGAQRLMCVEVITPGGNWSSYPPHRHDGEGDCQVNNEEVYYFRVGSSVAAGYSPDGFAMHRTYTADGAIDVNVAVYDADVFLIPRGYHGPCVAAPGYPLYYLNVLAGPSAERTMAFCDDPTHHWVRESWKGVPTDPRLPMTSATGPTGRPQWPR
jgi:5-deoxy-glucuronate isomerase